MKFKLMLFILLVVCVRNSLFEQILLVSSAQYCLSDEYKENNVDTDIK